jgi:hypothetical protein
MKTRRLPLNSRKLLVAAVGVAAVSYVGCNSIDSGRTSGNLMSPEPQEAGQFPPGPFPPTSGNLMAPDAQVVDAADDGAEAGASDASDDATDAADAADQ